MPRERWLGVLSALLHFVVVEIRPALVLGVSVTSVVAGVCDASYRAGKLCGEVCREDCNAAAATKELKRFLWKAMWTPDLNFHADDDAECLVSPGYSNDDLFPFFVYFLLALWLILVATCLYLFAREAYASESFGFRKGSYFLFTLRLERMWTFKVAVTTFVACACFASCLGIFAVPFFCLLRGETARDCRGELQYVVTQQASSILLLIYSAYRLQVVTIKPQLECWDEEMLRRVVFRRSFYKIFVASNDELYLQLVHTALDLCQGAPDAQQRRIADLCEDEQSAQNLRRAMAGRQGPSGDRDKQRLISSEGSF